MTLDSLASSLATLALLPPSATRLALAAQVADAGRRHLAPIPSWVTGYLERCLTEARTACLPQEQLVEPLLTLHLLTGREAYELEAITIINACYRRITALGRGGVPAATTGKNPASPQLTPLNVGMHSRASAPRPESGNALTSDLVTLISDLYTVVTASDYIEDYDPGIVLDAYHHICSLLHSSPLTLDSSTKALDSSQQAKLAEISEQLSPLLAEAV